ncbi:MAG: hypothetical protein HY078_17140 [Elusimicrobia bacterium]|nr:hypothetical protein [Elusimicrobiota bacterium]
MRLSNNLASLLPAVLLALAAPTPGRAAPAQAAPDPVALLNEALSPETAYQAKMVVTHWFGRQTRTEEVRYTFDPPNHYRAEFLDPSGATERIVVSDGEQELIDFVKQHKVVRGDAVKSRQKLMSEDVERDLLFKNYRATLLGTDKVVGRVTWIVELLPIVPGKQHQRLFIDKETHVILDSKRYRPNGSFAVRSQFTQFDPIKDLPDEIFRTVPDTTTAEASGGISRPDYMTMAELERAGGKSLGLPRELPGGFEFESGDFFVVKGHTIRHLRYTDGLTILSLFQTDQPVRQPRAAADSAPPTPKHLSGSTPHSSAGRVLQWKGGAWHYTLMSDISQELITQIAGSLGRAPSGKSPAPSPSAAVAGGTGSSVAHWNKTAGTIDAVDPAARQVRLRDKSGRVESYTLQDATEITRSKTKIPAAQLKPGDRVRLLRYETESRMVQRIILAP